MTAPERREEIDLDGRRFSYRVVGNGAPLVLLNGYSATAMDWDPVLLGALAESFEVVCPDNRGMGESELGDATVPFTIDSMATDVLRLLDALGIEHAPIAGWSMGGFIGQRIAAQAPARVEALILLGSDGGGPTCVRAQAEAWAQLTDHSGTFREQASRLIALLFPPPLVPMIDEAFGDLMAEARSTLSPAALTAQEQAMRAWHATPPTPPDPATAPRVLVLSGKEDVVIPPDNDEVLAGIWPTCEVERYDGGHAFFALQGAQVAERITAFCRG